MKVMLNSLVLLLLLAAIAGCGTELNNYYGSVKKPESELLANYKAVRFDVFALDILPQNPAQETITSLSAEGQAEAVKVLGAKYGKTEDFLSSLAKPLEVISKPSLTVRSKFKRRIVQEVYGKVYPSEPVNIGGQSLFIGQSEEKLLGGDVKRISVK